MGMDGRMSKLYILLSLLPTLCTLSEKDHSDSLDENEEEDWSEGKIGPADLSTKK